MASQSQVLLPLSDHFMQHCRRDPVDSEAADRNIIAILDILLDCLFDRGEFTHEGAAFVAEKFPRFVRIRISKDPSYSLFNNVH